ncbi:hypothetical protein BDM02DRAFT_3262742 [Thelephora ganbajun]|uniref:Uncharacterized protein n=1 Tax=Thelephora ganbajun TaxID=370292 RepID=A0ACB6Z964_THEGA|nr:hypothetical protein BDM02DRAFT_3262742 [Thelephora ganbajun]
MRRRDGYTTDIARESRAPNTKVSISEWFRVKQWGSEFGDINLFVQENCKTKGVQGWADSKSMGASVQPHPTIRTEAPPAAQKEVEAEEYNKEFMKKRDEDLNKTLIFSSPSFNRTQRLEETIALFHVLIHKIDNATFGDVPALPHILYASFAASLCFSRDTRKPMVEPALFRYLCEINTVASVVLGVTSFGVLVYTLIVFAGGGTASKGHSFQTTGANIIRRVLGLLRLAYAVIDVFCLGRTTFWALVVLVRRARAWLFGTPSVPDCVLRQYGIGMQFDETIRVWTLNFLGTILPLSGPNSSTASATAVECFGVFSGCFVTDDGGVTMVTRGSEQLAGIFVVCFLCAFPYLLSTEPASAVIRDVCQRYGRVFPYHIGLWDLQFYFSAQMFRGSPYTPARSTSHEDNLANCHTEETIRNRWYKKINERMQIDCLLTRTYPYERKPIKTKKVYDTRTERSTNTEYLQASTVTGVGILGS